MNTSEKGSSFKNTQGYSCSLLNLSSIACTADIASHNSLFLASMKRVAFARLGGKRYLAWVFGRLLGDFRRVSLKLRGYWCWDWDWRLSVRRRESVEDVTWDEMVETR